MWHRLWIYGSFAALACCVAGATGSESKDIQPFVQWLLEDGQRLQSVAFAEVVESVSGCEVLPVKVASEVDRQMLGAVREVLNACLKELNAVGHPVHQVARVNEVSRRIEDFLLQQLNAVEGLTCSVPLNASGDRQRSGYPDLRLCHEASGRVFYIDPKVYRAGSEGSGFRSFYFEPKKETNKILDNASHLIVGIAHKGKIDGWWQFESWQIVDLIDFKVRLKAEFQASNRDLYRESAVLGKSE